jgi:hypothetical protein
MLKKEVFLSKNITFSLEIIPVISRLNNCSGMNYLLFIPEKSGDDN